MSTADQQIRGFLPGPTPPGWSLATNSIVRRHHDGALVVAYTGHGLTVTIESVVREGSRGRYARRDHTIKVQRRDGNIVISDLDRVVDDLYRKSTWRKQLFDMSRNHPGLGTPLVKFQFAV